MKELKSQMDINYMVHRQRDEYRIVWLAEIGWEQTQNAYVCKLPSCHFLAFAKEALRTVQVALPPARKILCDDTHDIVLPDRQLVRRLGIVIVEHEHLEEICVIHKASSKIEDVKRDRYEHTLF